MNNTKKMVITLLISLMLFLLTGCGSSSISKQSSMVQEVTNRSVLDSSWQTYQAGGHNAARLSFEDALTDETKYDEKTKAELYNGLGWSIMKSEGFREAESSFLKAVKHCPDAKIGLAGSYLSSMDTHNIKEGIRLLESINIQNAHYEYEWKYDPGISNAQVHALMGLLYFLNDQEGKATPQFTVAGDIINGPGEELDAQSVNSILDQLFY